MKWRKWVKMTSRFNPMKGVCDVWVHARKSTSITGSTLLTFQAVGSFFSLIKYEWIDFIYVYIKCYCHFWSIIRSLVKLIFEAVTQTHGTSHFHICDYFSVTSLTFSINFHVTFNWILFLMRILNNTAKYSYLAWFGPPLSVDDRPSCTNHLKQQRRNKLNSYWLHEMLCLINHRQQWRLILVICSERCSSL